MLTPRALGPLHDIARQTGGRLAELLASGAPREQLFAALLDELDQEARPQVQVVVVEDAHWADEATLDLLVFLVAMVDPGVGCWKNAYVHVRTHNRGVTGMFLVSIITCGHLSVALQGS
jgi:predicted ATPase